jgi:hypothetical protein
METITERNDMVRVKNAAELKRIAQELEMLQDNVVVCVDMNDEDLNGNEDVYNQLYTAIATINDLLEK